jgi:hypothetical protein
MVNVNQKVGHVYFHQNYEIEQLPAGRPVLLGEEGRSCAESMGPKQAQRRVLLPPHVRGA